jgi:hypothetical protein
VLRSLGNPFRSGFTRSSPWRAFVNWQSYYGPYLGQEGARPLIQHTGPLVGDGARQVKLIEALSAGHLATMVWAPPGCGKSRFALELARRLEKAPSRWQVLLVNHDETAVREELPQLAQLKRLVLLVDDAHECPELVKLLAGAAATGGQSSSVDSMRLVCMSRTAGRADVTKAVNSALPPGLIQELDLGRPATKLVRSLIDQLLPKASPLHRDAIERFVRQSYFGAVLLCTLLSREGKLPQSFQRHYLSERICREPLREAAEGVCPIETALRALAVFAALSPVSRTEGPVLALASKLSGLSLEKLDELLNRALAAGLFQESGQSRIRPVPDLLGDLILEEACLDAQGKPAPFSTELLERAFELDTQAVGANCAEVGQLFGTDKDVDLVTKLVLERARTVPAGNKWDVRKLLQSCGPVARRRPLIAVEVASILETRGILLRAPTPEEFEGQDSVEADTYTLLLSAGEVDPSVVPNALRLGLALFTAAQHDKQARQSIRDSLTAYCRFEIGRSAPHSLASAKMLQTWMAESEIHGVMLAASLSGQYLTLEAEGQVEQGAHFARVPLTPTSEIWAVRDIAVDTLVRGTAHADAIVQCAAIGALERYASHQLPLSQIPIGAWQPQLAREIDLISPAMIQLAKATSSLPVRATVEHQGWLWWTQEIDALHRAGKAILEAIPDTDSYRLWKSLYAQRLPIHIVIPVEPAAAADSQARVAFFQKVPALREESAADQARQLFDKLDPQHSDTAAWRTIWLTALDQLPRIPMHAHAASIVGEFTRRHPDAAWSFINQADAAGPLFVMLPMLLSELRKLDRERYSLAARDVPAGTPLEDAWLQVVWANSDPDEAESTLLARGLESADRSVQHRAAAALLRASGTDRVNAFARVFSTIRRHPTDADLWELAIEQFVLWTEGVLPPQAIEPTEPMRRVAEELIKLFQACGSSLRWGFQRHTRQLSRALAVLAVILPQNLLDWMKREWGASAGTQATWKDESPLSVSRLTNILDPIRQSPLAAFWIDAFAEWMLNETYLHVLGAQGLAKLCALDDPKVGALAERIGGRPTEAALQSFTQFIRYQKSDRTFAHKALGLLQIWTRFPDSYAAIEAGVIAVLADGASSRLPGQPSPTHIRALEAIDACKARGVTPGLLANTLERAQREIREAINNDMARDAENADLQDSG